MNENPFDAEVKDMAWCPGCGNLSILAAVKQALVELGLSSDRVVMVSGIGQAAKIPHYLVAHFFNGLHGRALPPATAIKAANPGLTVIAESGDGDMYGEGGNHFIHTMRRIGKWHTGEPLKARDCRWGYFCRRRPPHFP